MALSSRIPSIKLVISYILDWIIIIGIAAVGGGVSFISPYRRPFSPVDLSISYPHVEHDLISTVVLVVISLIAPAIIIFLYSAILIPWPGKQSRTSQSTFWKRKLWEFNAGWMGLALSYALAFMITQGIKNLIGKPRPDLLSRCQPDLANIADHVVGGYFGRDVAPTWTLVSSSICTQTDHALLDEGFRSFLSGHSSNAWAGLTYLSLWLASKLNLCIPYLHPQTMINEKRQAEVKAASAVDDRSTLLPLHYHDPNSNATSRPVVAFERAAAPPLFGVAFCLVPVCVAFYIGSTRYVDFKHKGLDIFSGSVLGIMTAWLGFRLYHGSLTRGEGWAWSPRHEDKAFAVSSGSDGWVGGGSMPNNQSRPSTERPMTVGSESGMSK
ncbi:hypothetical protein AAFC00_005445 [Neodothiora populina]|uniref:Phosphatidic acid phosphatase type 2/haloperoxidase domain-containing protein n=1 Tax=Neodothiora populina TaxID=2781224 RepID=A0ABR3PL93_9PEZI